MQPSTFNDKNPFNLPQYPLNPFLGLFFYYCTAYVSKYVLWHKCFLFLISIFLTFDIFNARLTIALNYSVSFFITYFFALLFQGALFNTTATGLFGRGGEIDPPITAPSDLKRIVGAAKKSKLVFLLVIAAYYSIFLLLSFILVGDCKDMTVTHVVEQEYYFLERVASPLDAFFVQLAVYTISMTSFSISILKVLPLSLQYHVWKIDIEA